MHGLHNRHPRLIFAKNLLRFIVLAGILGCIGCIWLSGCGVGGNRGVEKGIFANATSSTDVQAPKTLASPDISAQVGTRVMALPDSACQPGGVNVRDEALDQVLFAQCDGVHGTVEDSEPGTAGGYTGTWWQINWDSEPPDEDGILGWTADEELELAPTAGDVPEPTFSGSDYSSNANIFWADGNAPSSTDPPDPQLGSALGNCTWYAFGRMLELGANPTTLGALHGNGGDWAIEASNDGLEVDPNTDPTVHSIAELDDNGNGYDFPQGHVAIVESVNADSTITVTESSSGTDPTGNWMFLWRHRTVPPSWFSHFIRVPLSGSAKSAPTVTLSPALSTINANQPLTETITVTGTSGGPTPSGTATLTVGGYTSSAATLVNGSAPIIVPANTLGPNASYPISANYSGDNNYNSATGSAAVNVNPASKITPTVTLSPALSTINANQPLTETITVTGTSGGPTPSGTATLTVGGYTSSAATLVNGSAPIIVPANTLGPNASYPISANYSGDNNYNSATGSAAVNVNPASTAPTVATSGSASVTSSGASVGGTVNPNGLATEGWFQYGTSSSLSGAQTTTEQNLGSGTSNTAYNASLSGLAAGTLYYFRAVAQNSAGTNYGSTASFTTSSSGGTAPTVATGGSASVTSSGASVGGTVNPNGLATEGWFQYGTSSSLSGAQTTTEQNLGSGTSNTAFNASLSGLAPGTLYYFRAVAQNSAGTNYGSTASFATSSSGGTGNAALALIPGVISTAVGNGTQGYLGDNGSPVNADINLSNGVAFDASGNLYLTDTANQRIRVVNREASAITVAGTTIQPGDIATVAGTGATGFGGDGNAAAQATFYQPDGIAVDSAGDIFIADTVNERIREINLSGTISTIAGNGTLGDSGNGIPATQAELYQPAGIALDSAGNLYIANSDSNVISVVNRQSSPITLAGVTIQPGDIATIAGNGTAGYSGDNEQATQAELNRPTGVAVDSQGNLYIADTYNAVVRKVSLASGTITTFAGTTPPGNSGFTGDGGPANHAQFQGPDGVTVDPAGDVYILDSGNNRVRMVSATTGIITTVAGGGPGSSSDVGDGGSATSAFLNFPIGAAIDASGNLWIADTVNNRVREVNVQQASLVFGSVSVGQSSTAQDVAVSNVDSQTINITNIEASAGFNTTSPDTTCSAGAGLISGGTCIIGIVLAPSQAGSIAGSVTLTDSASNSPQTVFLSGTGTSAQTVTPTPSSITTTQPLSVQVTVNGPSGSRVPTGSVMLSGPGYTSEAQTLSSGATTFNIPAGELAAGSDTLTATYTPDSASSATYSSATGTSSAVTVTKAVTTPTVTVTPSASSITTAQPLTVTVTVSGGSGNPTPTGSVTVTGGGYTSAAATLSSGSATISILAGKLSAGSDTLTATYSGDSNYNTATGTRSVTVSPAPSFTLSAQSTAVNIDEGGNNTDTVTLTPANGFTGSVTFSVTGLPNGVTASFNPNPTTTDSSVLTLTATSTAAVGGPATATITGTSGSLTASTMIGVTVTAAPSLLTPTVNVSPANNGTFDASQSEAITVTVSGTGATPTGTVTLSGGGYTSSATALSSGSAIITLPANTFSSSGNVTLTASYSGNSVYTTGTGTASVTVNPPYKLSTSTPSAVNPGSPATATITLTADPSYSGSVSLSCTPATSPSDASDPPTCSVTSGSQVTITNGVASGTATVTISTTAPTSASLDGHSLPGWLSAGGGTALAFLVFFGIPARRRNWRHLLGLLVITVAIGSLSACGGSGSGQGTGGGGSNPGTTAGTYTFTVSSTSTPAINPAPAVTITLTIN